MDFLLIQVAALDATLSFLASGGPLHVLLGGDALRLDAEEEIQLQFFADEIPHVLLPQASFSHYVFRIQHACYLADG